MALNRGWACSNTLRMMLATPGSSAADWALSATTALCQLPNFSILREMLAHEPGICLKQL